MPGAAASCEGRAPPTTHATVRFRGSYAVRLEGSSWPTAAKFSCLPGNWLTGGSAVVISARRGQRAVRPSRFAPRMYGKSTAKLSPDPQLEPGTPSDAG